MCLRRDLER